MLVGRDAEVRRVTALLDEARRGRSGVLVLVGEPGVGKTALLEEARTRAADMLVLAATGVESESELPFAVLHELLRPVLDLLPSIAPTQARALAAALALEDGEPDMLAVGAGALSLIVEAAEDTPVLLLLDDVHWLDRASADALAFATRRLRMEQVAVVAASRLESAPALGALPQLELEPLAAEDARRLLRMRANPVSAADEPSVLAAAAGNPLALLELPVDLARDLPSTTTSHERLRRAFAQRVDALPETTKRGLLLAAAEHDLQTVRRAAESLHLGDPLPEAEAVGLIRVGGGSVAFRHPVVRSLVYANATDADRTAAHLALAGVLDAETDADRRAWHLAAATDGVDEEVAATLEKTAQRAGARGGHAAEARALERAARLSPQKEDRARRLHAASRAAFWAGEARRALELAEEALPLTDDPLLRADLLVQIGAVGEWRGAGLPASAYLDAADRGGLDDERVSKLLYQVVKLRLDDFDAAGAAALAPRLEDHARRAGPWWGPRHLAGAAAAYLAAGERDKAEPLLRELVANPAIPAGYAYDYLAVEWYDELRSSLAETLREGRASGNLVRIVWNQTCSAHLELRLGRLTAAAACAAEAIPIGETIGTPALVGAASAALAAVHAWRGEAEACDSLARVAIAAARDSGDRYQEGIGHHSLALLALGDARSADAIVELEPMARLWRRSTLADPAAVPFVPDLVEAYARSDAAGKARDLLDRFDAISRPAGNTWMLAACLRCEGLLEPAEGFDSAFSAAIELLERSPYSLDLARTRLAYGERLRRAGRRRDAEAQLRPSFEAFAAVGAVPWQERAAQELRGAGVRVSSEPRPRVDLTPQELHIASLVADGKTNKEIAAALFLSAKTVEYHLANTFRKLDIHSRAELARIVTADQGPRPPDDADPKALA